MSFLSRQVPKGMSDIHPSDASWGHRFPFRPRFFRFLLSERTLPWGLPFRPFLRGGSSRGTTRSCVSPSPGSYCHLQAPFASFDDILFFFSQDRFLILNGHDTASTVSATTGWGFYFPAWPLGCFSADLSAYVITSEVNNVSLLH